MNSEIETNEIFPPPSATPPSETPRIPPQVVSPAAVAPVRKPPKVNRFAVFVLLLCAILIVILCVVSRDFRVVFFAASAIWFVLHAIIRLFKL